jgi:hypothetical protein
MKRLTHNVVPLKPGISKEKGMFSSLFKRNTKPLEASLDTYAIYPIALMLEGRPPFGDWKDPESNTEPDLEEFFRGCVWMYQMWIYYIFTAKRFGYEIADKVASLQAESLSRGNQELGGELYLAIQQIQGIVSRYTEEPFVVPFEGKDIEWPVEYAIALEFLTLSEESPFHTSKTEFDEKGVPDFRHQDFALAAWLERGKMAAQGEFLAFTRDTKVIL